MITPSDHPVQLLNFIENGISLAFTLLTTAEVAGSEEEHRKEALKKATEAFNMAQYFAAQVPMNLALPHWESRLSELQIRLAQFQGTFS